MIDKIYTHVDKERKTISVIVPEGWYADVRGDLDEGLNVIGISNARCWIRTLTAPKPPPDLRNWTWPNQPTPPTDDTPKRAS